MKKTIVFLLALAAMVIGLCGRSNAQDRYLYRFYDPAGDHHFYTADYNEAVFVDFTLEWNYEGIEARVWSAGGDGRIPVYRLYNPVRGDHRYVTNFNVLINSIHAGYNFEQVACWVYPYKTWNTSALYMAFRDYAAPSYFLWWLISPGHSQDDLLTMRYNEIYDAVNYGGFGGDYGIADTLGYAAPGYNGVN